MKYREDAGAYLLKLEIGEEVMASLVDFARQTEIAGATIMAIGAMSDPVIGYFNTQTKEYDRRELSGDFEIVGLTGNIGWRDGEPMVHAHVVLSSPVEVHAGHLFSGTVCVTGEFVIRPMEQRLERRRDPDTGLYLWDLA